VNQRSRTLLVSLDFELRWGVYPRLRDRADEYRAHLEGEREAVPAMLELFSRTGIRATWAVVGAVGCDGWDEWEARNPGFPHYANEAVRWSPSYQKLDPGGRLHFAPELVAQIARTPGQELASHTFNHIFMLEPGCTDEDVRRDSLAVNRLFEDKYGAAPRSIVFPRNQVAKVEVLEAVGLESWRDVPAASFWEPGPKANAPWARAARMLDSLVPLGPRNAPGGQMRASHFVRFDLARPLWRAHVRRIVDDAKRLRDGDALHLWWHPHDLGGNVARGIQRATELIDEVQSAVPFGTVPASMIEAARAYRPATATS
jgi:hypothetical protein